jgi:uncharacterized membrane protein
MIQHSECVVAVFPSPAKANSAVGRLENHGWSSEHISVIAPGSESQLSTLESLQHSDQTEKSAAIGGATGAALGLLAGSSLFIIPGLGPVLFAGAMASGITGGLVGGLLGAMSGWGVRDDHVRQYEEALKHGKAIVVLTGDPSTLAEGRAELLASSAEKVEMHAETADSDHVDA